MVRRRKKQATSDVVVEEKGIEFREKWFAKETEPIWNRHLLDGFVVDSYLEIGVAEGHSMRWILEHLNPLRCVGVDPWIPPRENQREAFEAYVQNCLENLKPFMESGQLTLEREMSQRYFSRVHCQEPPPTFDLIYIDGEHKGPDALLDMLQAYQLLSRPVMGIVDPPPSRRRTTWEVIRPGGRMVIDDLQRIYRSGKPLVLPAVMSFEMIAKGRCERVWKDGRQICFEAIPVRSDQQSDQHA